MGLLRTLTGRDRAVTGTLTASHPSLGPLDPSTFPISTPWGSSTLQRIVYEDVFGSDLPLNTREAAMRIPAISSSRNLVVSAVAAAPMVELAPGEQVPDPIADPEGFAAFRAAQPTWLYRTNDSTPPQHKLAWTADDLIFYGWSCWSRVNDARSRFPLLTRRVNIGDWTINDDNKVEIDGIEQKDEDVIVFSGWHEGILSYGRDVIADSRQLYAIVRQRLASPVPPLDLHQTEGVPLSPTEIDDLIDRWVVARNNPSNGGVGFTSKAIEAKPLQGTDDGQLMIEARNAAAVDGARIVGVPAGMVDATAPKASLNYETQAGRNQEFVDYTLRLYMGPIAARLSQDDVTTQGKHIAFDLTNYTAPVPSPTGPALGD